MIKSAFVLLVILMAAMTVAPPAQAQSSSPVYELRTGVATIYDATWSNTRSASGYNNTTLYTGRELDPETGFYQYRNRYYSAELGRFVSRDPSGYEAKDVNLYRYVFGNPLTETDPTGLDFFADKGITDLMSCKAWCLTEYGGWFVNNDLLLCYEMCNFNFKKPACPIPDECADALEEAVLYTAIASSVCTFAVLAPTPASLAACLSAMAVASFKDAKAKKICDAAGK